MNWQYATGVAAILAMGYGAWLYIKATRAGDVKPHFWTWATFFIGATGGVISTVQGGAGVSGTLGPAALAILLGTIFVLSWKKKYRHQGLERWYHPWAAVFALVVYALQLSLHGSPLFAAAAAILADFSALHIQVWKSWKDPKSEEISPWAWGSLGGLLAVVSLSEWTAASLAFPAYFLITNLLLVAILKWRQRRVGPTAEVGTVRRA